MDDGGYVRVRAAPELCADIRCTSRAKSTRVAWHIGNRHVPLQILPDGALRIRRDHVIMAMVENLGAQLDLVTVPFAPRGARPYMPLIGP
ncbi:MAG: hypothetical protein O7I42_20730 [Alphaproteobacteria bacterium]|nr:hypothetical protein [Alphaproteobacteria bacterium]